MTLQKVKDMLYCYRIREVKKWERNEIVLIDRCVVGGAIRDMMAAGFNVIGCFAFDGEVAIVFEYKG